ncbi:MAG: hypothetical protein F6K44_28545 [Moorea sp. SIO3E2]|nr:hypothetical protein [Moorena sp. SIO3E2]
MIYSKGNSGSPEQGTADHRNREQRITGTGSREDGIKNSHNSFRSAILANSD